MAARSQRRKSKERAASVEGFVTGPSLLASRLTRMAEHAETPGVLAGECGLLS
jgi:hypothetical protein